jgi:C1A family cysteine protease
MLNREKYSIANADGLTPLVPSPIDLSHLDGKKLFMEDLIKALPSYFDLREEGRLSPVKDQGECGACWSFSTLACLESLLLPFEALDFSENNLKNTHGFDPDHCQGGLPFMPICITKHLH